MIEYYAMGLVVAVVAVVVVDVLLFGLGYLFLQLQ